MSVIDAVISAVTIVFAVTVVVSPRVGLRAAPIVLPLLVLGCAVQWALEDFYWQFVPIYLVIVATGLAVWTLGLAQPRRKLPALTGRGLLGLLAAVAVLPWSLVPVPELPEPTGRYAVGSAIFRWVDEQRPEAATDSAEDRRNVVVQAWYPTQVDSGRQYVYLDGVGRLPDRVTQIPGFVMRRYDHIDTNARAEVPVSPDRERWPVVLFSPGYGAPRAFYTGLITDLASRGFVVFAVDHPYEAAVTELADGTLATLVERLEDDDPDGNRYMSEQLGIRTADLRFVVDQLSRPEVLGPLENRIDTDHVAVVGHSFGGASAAAALADDPRIDAAANIDGTLYGTLPEQSLRQPFLLVQSDHSETGHSQRFLDGNRTLLEHLAAPGFRYEIAQANHYSFTDVPLFLSAPARFAAAQVIGGSRGPQQTQRATNDILVAFLAEPFGGPAADIAAAAARYPDIHGGRVR
ncbi:dienelactone hydrolase family protein [Nocardia sp. NPDC050710]|uniref:alpha/beta hydrolase family protein n=1 Tax=Nocardia sp. NPDC050710 TaxID=3157220 RepID=UPI0033D04F22